MRTSTSTLLLLLASTFTLAAGCDDGHEDGLIGDDLAFRCVGSGCGNGGGLGNSSILGTTPLSNLSVTFNQYTANEQADLAITGGQLYVSGALRTITQIEVEDDGELVLHVMSDLGGTFPVTGDGVRGARLYLAVDPNDPNEPSYNAALRIADVHCERGKYDQFTEICRYDFITNVEPDDPELYPEHDEYKFYYSICPDLDDGGILGADKKFSAVLSPNVVLSSGVNGPSIGAAPGKFIVGCLNAAVSKTQYHLNAFYDPNAEDRALDASQGTAALKMWMAWHDGAPRTVPGKIISPHDPINGLFTWTNASGWGIEAGYDADGASCRGGSTLWGLHRHIYHPLQNLTGWLDLPYCTAATLDEHAVLGVKVEDPSANNAS